jgi:hypothetical protein
MQLHTKIGALNMAYPLNTTLSSEVRQIMRNHINQLNQYTNLIESEESKEVKEIIVSFEQLQRICAYPPDMSDYATYEDAVQCLATTEQFLRLTYQPKDAAFYKTYIGQIYAQANQWCSIVGQQFGFSIDKVWELIAPAVPDCLSEVQSCVYEAKWWKPVPLMDIEILKRTEGIIIYGDIYEIGDLPKGLAVRFSVVGAEAKAARQ